jgi:hypothetical protein
VAPVWFIPVTLATDAVLLEDIVCANTEGAKPVAQVTVATSANPPSDKRLRFNNALFINYPSALLVIYRECC